MSAILAVPVNGNMAWIERHYSKGRINRAGDDLISLDAFDPRREESLAVINNWRSCHGYPLQAIKMTLLSRARAVDSKALIAQRLKRLSSMAIKLKDNPTMKLSQMQDIGGCRAIVGTVANVARLVKIYEKYQGEYGDRDDRPILAEKYDYIKYPKPDGYRSVHLVYKYQSRHEHKRVFDGQRVEIQIRSRLQHAWATAVETSQAFTGQALKAKIKTASSPEWLKFFALMGSAIAAREGRPLVPGTPEKKEERSSELRRIIKQERIIEHLSGWHATMQHLEASRNRGAHTFLLMLDTGKRVLNINPYRADEFMVAQTNYLDLEKRTENDPQIQVVLVRVDSIDALRTTYPNFHADSSAFIDATEREISERV